MQWNLKSDGSFSLVAGDLALLNCYPSIDGQPVRPLSVDVSDGEIRYRLNHGEIVLRFESGPDGASLSCQLLGFSRLPWRFAPIAGTLTGAEQLYRLGLGFSGPSGWLDIPASGPLFSHESHIVTAFRTGDTTLAAAALKHDRYLHKAIISNRHSRRGLTGRHVDIAAVHAEFTFFTESTPAADRLELPTLKFLAGADAYATLKSACIDVAKAMNARNHMPSRYHWCSWYEKGCNFSFDDLRATLDGLAKLPNRPALQTIQIDDGYCPSPGDWLTPSRLWPGGLPAAFDLIRSHGYNAGIWVAPFMVGSLSRLFAEHPDWIIRDHSGKPIVEWKKYDASGIPSHIDPEHYALDASHPGVQDYLRQVFRTLRSWGATFYKTDFMDWGLRDTESVKRYNPNETSVESFRKILAIIREEIGDDSYWLACISPYGPFLGFADGMRIANDVGPHWGDGSHGNMIAESFATQPFNNIFWQNDPDAILLRNYHNDLTDLEVRSLAVFQGFLGSAVNFSDAPHKLPPDRLALMHFLRPPEKVTTARIPFFAETRPLRYLVRDVPGGHAILAINPGRTQAIEACSLSDLIGLDRARVYTWTPDSATDVGELTTLLFRLAPHEAQIFFVSPTGQPPTPGMTLLARPA